MHEPSMEIFYLPDASPSHHHASPSSTSTPATPHFGLASPFHRMPRTRGEGHLLTPSSSIGSPNQQDWDMPFMGQDDMQIGTQCIAPGFAHDSEPHASMTVDYNSAISAQDQEMLVTCLPMSMTDLPYDDSQGQCMGAFDSVLTPRPSIQRHSFPCTPESLVMPHVRHDWYLSHPRGQLYPYFDQSDQDWNQIKIESPPLVPVLFGSNMPFSTTSSNDASMLQDNNYPLHSMKEEHTPGNTRSSTLEASPQSLDGQRLPDKKIEGKRQIFACTRSGCAYSSHRKANRNAHEKTHNPKNAKPRVACNYGTSCTRTFNRKTDMDRHVNNVSSKKVVLQASADSAKVHLKLRRMVCPYCAWGFGRGDTLRRYGQDCIHCEASADQLLGI